jgi:diaminopimelate epimerase
MCGNGIRCVGKFVYDYGFTDKTTIDVISFGQKKVLELNVEDGEVKSVKVNMGSPILTPSDVPVAGYDNMEKVVSECQNILDALTDNQIDSVFVPQAEKIAHAMMALAKVA